MWIRTQDKEKLLKVKNLTLSRMWKYDHKRNLQWLDSYCVKEEEHLELGIYSSKDKALKVLDMIQKFLDNEFLMCVFQMPQDVDVEV